MRSLLCVAMVLLASCAADPATRVPPLEPAPAGLTSPVVADRFEKALDGSGPIHVKRRSFQNGRSTLSCDAWMTADSVRTDIYEDGKHVYTQTVRGWLAQERVPPGAVAERTRGPRFEEFIAPSPYWLDYGKLVSVPWGCHVGDCTGTWLAPDRRLMQETLTPRLASGRLLGVAEVGGRRCAAVQYDFPPMSDGTKSGFTYYVDLESGWVLRDDHFQQTGIWKVVRVSLFEVEPADPSPSWFDLRVKGRVDRPVSSLSRR